MKKETDSQFFLEGNWVGLRGVEESDLPTIYPWYNSAELVRHTGHHRYPNTLQKQKQLYESQISNRSLLSFTVIEKKTGNLIGTITLMHICHLNQKAEMAVHIFSSSKEKPKIALEAVLLLIHHGFFTLNLNKIYSGMMEGLVGWVSLLSEFLGFQREGIRRQDVYKEGRFHDVIEVSLLREEYEALLKKTKQKPLDFSISIK